ncbi:MAG: type 1 glutamine amidotransferase [Myxococcales bacterium]|nr:type 1 glutamine amidotransferase [Myxococcales bacterium]
MPRPIVTVLRCDDVPEPDKTRHGDTHERMLAHLEKAAAMAELELELRVIDVRGGELPAPDDPSALFVTTGSATNPDNKEPWVLAFRDWLAANLGPKRPIYGVCFGHQLVAYALGGTTGRHPDGWEIGNVSIRQTFSLPSGGAASGAPFEPLPDGPAADVGIIMSHQDEVTTQPPGAIPWMTGSFCLDQGYVIPGVAVTLQGHPEFEAEQASDIYRRRRERLGSDATDQAVESTQKTNDGVSISAEVLRYFLG